MSSRLEQREAELEDATSLMSETRAELAGLRQRVKDAEEVQYAAIPHSCTTTEVLVLQAGGGGKRANRLEIVSCSGRTVKVAT